MSGILFQENQIHINFSRGCISTGSLLDGVFLMQTLVHQYQIFYIM